MKRLRFLIIACGFIMFSYSSFAQDIPTFMNPNKNEKVKVQTDTILYKYQYEQMWQDLQKQKKDNTFLEEKVQSLERRIAQLDDTEIDRFLNIQDTTIFGSKFKKIAVTSIPLRSREFFLLIQNIHDLNELLTEIENMNISQFSSVGIQLTEARLLIDDINSFATIEKRRITDYLSEAQKQYFRDLVKRYNELNASLNRGTQGMNNEK